MAEVIEIPLDIPLRDNNVRNQLGRGFVPIIATPPGSHFTPLPHEATPLTLGPSTGPPARSTPGADPASTPVWPPFVPYSVRHDTPVPMIAQLLPPSDWTPGTFPALPYGSPVPFYVHPHLIYNPNNPSVPVLQWDILHSAEVARIFTGRHSVIPVDLKAEAIFPVVNKVYIVTDHPILARWMERWGPIVAEADRITVRDVLDAIHEYFEQPLTRRDIQTIKAIPGNYTDLVYAAHRRVAEAYQLTTLGLRTGFRRLDAIGGHRRFQGLRPVVYQNRTWKLFLGLLPGPVPAVY